MAKVEKYKHRQENKKMKRKHVVPAMAVLLILGLFKIVNAAGVILTNVPYMHQVLDMDDTEFVGHNACGPTTASIMVQFHKVQPDTSGWTYPGWYVWNSYDGGFTDNEGNDYSTESAEDWYGNYVYGAHGYIVDEYIQECGGWCTNGDKFENYLNYHGLVIQRVAQNYFQTIKDEIDAGRPLVGHSIIFGEYSHYLIIVGYDTGENEDEENVIVNDPYGDACNGSWNGTTSGEGKTYPLVGYCGPSQDRHVNINYVYTVKRPTVDENFDSYSTGGLIGQGNWIGNGGCGTGGGYFWGYIDVKNSNYSTSPNSITTRTVSTPACALLDLSGETEIENSGYVSAHIRVKKATTSNNNAFEIHAYSSTGYTIFQLHDDTGNNYLYTYDGGGTLTLKNPLPGSTYFTVYLEFDNVAKKVRYKYENDSWTAWRNFAVTSGVFEKLKLEIRGTGSVWFDDVEIKAGRTLP